MSPHVGSLFLYQARILLVGDYIGNAIIGIIKPLPADSTVVLGAAIVDAWIITITHVMFRFV